jgi:hypothetical protein
VAEHSINCNHTASNSRTPPSYPPNLDTWTGWSGWPLRLNYTQTTWTGRMAWGWTGHGSPSSTLSKDMGSIRCSIASPNLAIRPPHCPFQDTTRSRPFPYFLSLISHVITSNFSPYIFFRPPHHIPLMSGDPLARPQGALKKGRFL